MTIDWALLFLCKENEVKQHLTDAYVKFRTITETAEYLGVADTTLRWELMKRGVDRYPKGKRPVDKRQVLIDWGFKPKSDWRESLKAKYHATLNMYEMGRQAGVNGSTVYYWMKKEGLERTGRRKVAKNHSLTVPVADLEQAA